jgi:hypothetical protein
LTSSARSELHAAIELTFAQFGRGYGPTMGLILVLLVIALILAGVGFAVHVLWIIAVIFFIAWLVGLVIGTGRKSKT